MNSLPAEVVDEISQYLEFEDLKSVRRVSRFFADRVTPRVFSSVAIWLQKDSVEILEHISQQEHLRGHVKHLRVAFDLFLVTLEGLNITYCTKSRFCDEGGFYKDSPFSTGLGSADDFPFLVNTAYCECVEVSDEGGEQIVRDQKWIEKPEVGSMILGRALRNLRNLKSIEVSGHVPDYARDHCRIYPKATLGGSTADYHAWWNASIRTQLHFLTSAVVAAGDEFNLRDFSISDPEFSVPTMYHPGHRSIVHASTLTLPSPEALVLAAKAFQWLEKLEWACDLGTRSYEKVSCLCQYLRVAPYLKEISFANLYASAMNFSVLDAFSADIWRELRALRLVNVTIEDYELLGFLARHSNTVKILELVSCDVSIQDLPAFPLPSVEALSQLLKSYDMDGTPDLVWYFDREANDQAVVGS